MAAAIPIVVSMVGAYMSYQSQQDAASAQEKISRENARQQEMAAEMNARRTTRETEEESRRMKDQQRKQESTARAKAAASGVQMSGSISSYLEGMMSENVKQREWLEKSGKSKAEEYLWSGQSSADITRMEGSMRADASRMKGYGALVSGVGSAYTAGVGTYW